MDDWSQIIEPMARHTLLGLDWANRRPLLGAPLQILDRLFGVNVHAFYLVAWCITALTAVVLYTLVRRLKPDWQWRAWAVAALTLVYPADFSQMWLAHVLHARIGWLLTLLAAHWLLTFLERRSIGWLVMATGLSFISLLLYEAQLGVFIAFGLLLIAFKRAVSWRTRLLLLIPLAVNGLYMVWRTIGFRVVGIQDQYLGELTLNPGELINRLVLGLQVLLWSWTEPVRRALQIDSNGLVLVFMLLALGGMALGVMWLAGRKSMAATPVQTTSVQPDWLPLLIGLGLSVAGYFPTILLYQPNLDGVYSRVNFYTLPGAALCIVMAVSLSVRRLARGDDRRWRAGFLAVMAILIGVGMTIQLWVRHNAEMAWEEQRGIWEQLFQLAPGLEPNTVVCFVLADYGGQAGFANWWRTPLSADWEISAALRLLYDDPTLQGEIIMPGMMGYGEAKLLPTGVQNRWTGTVAPYARTVFVAYDRDRKQLTLLTDVRTALGLTWPLVEYEPLRHLAPSTPQVALRRLVVEP